jgi:hypothetical protein
VPLVAGLFTAAGFAVEELVNVFRITAVGVFLTGTGLLVGAVSGPPAQARAPIARVAAMVGSIITGDQCTRKRGENTGKRKLTGREQVPYDKFRRISGEITDSS